MKNKVLFVDIGNNIYNVGDKHRSRFIWDELRQEYQHAFYLQTLNNAKKDQLVYSIGLSPSWLGFKHRYHISVFQKHRLFRHVQENNYDLIFIRGISAIPLVRYLKRKKIKTPILFDMDMLYSRLCMAEYRQLKGLEKFSRLFESFFARYYENQILQLQIKILLSSQKEIKILSRFPGLAKIYPLTPPLEIQDFWLPEVPADKYILFYGSLNHFVNKDALSYFINSIYPKIYPILEKHGCDFYIAGKSPTHEQIFTFRKKKLPRIRFIGEVDDIHYFIKNAQFVFLPLRLGSGMRKRILETGALAKTVITTPAGLEGLNFENDIHLKLTSQVKSMVSAIDELLGSADKCLTLGAKLQKAVEEQYSTKRSRFDLKKVLDQ